MQPPQQPLLLLVDGNDLIHRAFHALPPLTTSKTGEMVNAVYGFTNTLLKVVADQKATHWAIAFDYPAPTFRHEMFDQYKAHRPPTPEELRSQIRRVHELVSALGMPAFEVAGYEADDILGALAIQSHNLNMEAAILTGDRDLLQMAGPGIRILLPGRNFSEALSYDAAAVEARFGVSPGQFAAYKALVGDPSDNIPGVQGVGDKTAVRLLTQFKSLEGIYEHLTEVTPQRLQAILFSSRTQAELSQRLATIVTDIPVQLALSDCAVGEYRPEQALSLFTELEFTRLLSRLPPAAGADAHPEESAPVPTQSKVQVVSGAREEREALEKLAHAPEIVISLALDGNGRRRVRRTLADAQAEATALGVAVSAGKGHTFYVPLEPMPSGPLAQLPLEQPLGFLASVLENEECHKICEDAKALTRQLSRYGLTLKGLAFDISIAAHLAGDKNVSLQSLALTQLGLSLPDTPDSGGGLAAGDDDIARWLAQRSDTCWALKEPLETELERKGLGPLFRDVELPLIPVLAAMEESGILIDTAMLREMSRRLSDDLMRLEVSIYNEVGHMFNVNSPRQLGSVLFDELGLPGGRKTKSGYSTEAALLETLRNAHPVIDLVLQYRQLSKLKSTYVDTLPALVNPRTGRVHTAFSQTGTTTGRLSSSEPNLQNLPVRSELGKTIRAAVIAPAGRMLLSADYSQIDLRALAHLSQDRDLLSAFANDEDIHRTTASKVFDVPADEVTPDMRRAAKVVNFGVVYGMSDYGLEQATGFTRAEASRFIKAYFEQYPGVRRWIERTKESAREDGYVQTLLGRRRYILEIRSTNRQVREAAERMAVNAPVQGTSADIIKVAMIRIHEAMRTDKLRSRMLLQIHDELLFEVLEDERAQVRQIVERLMPHAVALSVPIKVDLKAGPNWADMTPVT